MSQETETKRAPLPRLKLWIALTACILAAASALVIFFTINYVVYDGHIYKADITSIDLQGAQELDLDRLCRMEELELIDLRGSALTPQQADELHRRLPDCRLLWTITLAGEQHTTDADTLALTAPTADDLELLRFFYNLRQVEVDDCALYDLLLEQNRSAGYELSWTVPLCGEKHESSVETLALPGATAEDIALLDYMPALTSVDFSGSTAYDAILDYAQSNTDINVNWTVQFCSDSCRSDTETLSLPDATAEDIALLDYLPALASVDFSGSTAYDAILEYAQRDTDIEVKWTVDLYGHEISSDAEEADISGTRIRDLDALDALLKYLPNLKKLIMCNCGQTNKALDAFNKSHENLRIVWMVYFGKWACRTDATVFSAQNWSPPDYYLRSREADVLRYCTDLEMLDLGHAMLTTVEPFAELTNLKVLILADNWLTDISPLANLTQLEYLEIFKNKITDISVVRNMPNLTHVNLCRTQVSDPSPLYELEHLERLWMSCTPMSTQTKQELQAALPDVEFDLTTTDSSTAGSWRKNDTYYRLVDGFDNHNGMNDFHW